MKTNTTCKLLPQSYSLLKFIVPFFVLKGADHPQILAFNATALHGHLAVGTHLVPECPPPPPIGCGSLSSKGVHKDHLYHVYVREQAPGGGGVRGELLMGWR